MLMSILKLYFFQACNTSAHSTTCIHVLKRDIKCTTYKKLVQLQLNGLIITHCIGFMCYRNGAYINY